MSPETPIRDIVDHCRVWESHADTRVWRIVKQGLEKALPVYMYILPAPSPKPIPTELESLLQRLLSGVPAPTPTPPPKTEITDMETLLQHLLPGTPVSDSWTRPGPISRDWATIVCFSCSKLGHGGAGAPNWMCHSRICCGDGRREATI